MKTNPLVPDWSSYMTKTQLALYRAEQAFLLSHYETGVKELSDAQEWMDEIRGWLIRRDCLESIK